MKYIYLYKEDEEIIFFRTAITYENISHGIIRKTMSKKIEKSFV